MNLIILPLLVSIIESTDCVQDMRDSAVEGNLLYYSLVGKSAVFCGGFFNDKDYVAALSPSRFGCNVSSFDHPLCYKTIIIKGPKCTALSKILDMNPSCQHDDVAVTPSLYNKLVGGSGQRYGVKWDLFPEFDDMVCSGSVVDSNGKTVSYYEDVPKIFEKLKKMNLKIGLISNTTRIIGTMQLIQLFGWEECLSFREIYIGSLVVHFQKIHEASGIEYSRMIFFNRGFEHFMEIRDLGVFSLMLVSGISLNIVEEGIKHYQEDTNT